MPKDKGKMNMICAKCGRQSFIVHLNEDCPFCSPKISKLVEGENSSLRKTFDEAVSQPKEETCCEKCTDNQRKGVDYCINPFCICHTSTPRAWKKIKKIFMEKFNFIEINPSFEEQLKYIFTTQKEELRKKALEMESVGEHTGCVFIKDILELFNKE